MRRNVIKANKKGGIWTRKRGRGTILENRIIENLGPGIKNEEGHRLIGHNIIEGNRGKDIEDDGGATQNDRYTCQTLKKVPWVDDNPSNNDELIDRYRPLGIGFDLALNTKQALDFLAHGDYAWQHILTTHIGVTGGKLRSPCCVPSQPPSRYP